MQYSFDTKNGVAFSPYFLDYLVVYFPEPFASITKNYDLLSPEDADFQC